MWLNLQIFGFRALWSPYFLSYVVLLALAYYVITGPLRHKFSTDAPRPSGLQQFYFYTAMLLLYIVKGSPIDLLTHIMLTFHMVQMAIYLLVVPILIIKGIPAWFWSKIVYVPIIRPIVKLLTKPLISLLLFNTLFSIYHIPGIFNFTKSSQIAHSSASIILITAAFIVWWPILSPLKEFNKMQPLLKMAYIAANGVLITPACVLIIFASNPLFEAYSQSGAWIQAMSLCVPGNVLDGLQFTISGPEMFSSMSTVEDQQLGGIIMKSMQEIVYIFLLARIYFVGFSKESRKIDPLPADWAETSGT